MSETKAQASDLIQVTLKKPHTHAGQDHKAGDKLNLRKDQVERLQKHGKV